VSKLLSEATLNHASICSGIGGDLLALEQAGVTARHRFISETDSKAAQVLDLHFPNVPNIGNFQLQSWSDDEKPQIDILSCGLPGQAHSYAKGGQPSDASEITPEMLDFVKLCQPACVVVESVKGSIGAENGRHNRRLLRGLREAGYKTAQACLDARSFGASIRSERLWTIGFLGPAGRGCGEIFTLAQGDARRAAKGEKKRSRTTARSRTRTDILHPSAIGTLMASGAGMIRTAGFGGELNSIIVQKLGRKRICRYPTRQECLRLQGFPEWWLDHIAEFPHRERLHACRLIGNAMQVQVAAFLFRRVALQLLLAKAQEAKAHSEGQHK
jgi:DNA (cytosine-5)-methyltransferase 1